MPITHHDQPTTETRATEDRRGSQGMEIKPGVLKAAVEHVPQQVLIDLVSGSRFQTVNQKSNPAQ